MKKSWKLVDPKLMDSFDTLDELLSLENGYYRYRRHIASLHPNLIPFMAPLLRDIRHIYDGNPRPEAKDEFNYELMILLGKVFLEVHSLLLSNHWFY